MKTVGNGDLCATCSVLLEDDNHVEGVLRVCETCAAKLSPRDLTEQPVGVRVAPTRVERYMYQTVRTTQRKLVLGERKERRSFLNYSYTFPALADIPF